MVSPKFVYPDEVLAFVLTKVLADTSDILLICFPGKMVAYLALCQQFGNEVVAPPIFGAVYYPSRILEVIFN